MCKRQMCLVALVLLLGSGTAAQADVTDGLKGLWEFNNAGNLIEASLGNDLILNGAGQSAVAGVSGTDGAVAVELGTSYQADHGIPANGGGSYVNEFTLLFDVMYPQESAGKWRAFYQTGYETYNDSEYFIHPSDESWGVGDLGYTDNATLGEWYSSHSTWYRAVLTVNLDNDSGAAFHDLYIDGVLKGKHNTGSLGIDGRFALYTADDADPYIVFCGDDNGDDALMHFSNIAIWDRPLTPQEIAGLGGPGDPIMPLGSDASKPNPDNEATDVPRDVILSWTPGEFAALTNGHKVYLSESFNDVNDGIGGIIQDANSYARPQRLDFNTTYYWRVDEVNAPPSSTVFEGNVWSFTTEPIAYPIDGSNIIATASSIYQADQGPENTINGLGLDVNDMHSTVETNMWLSDEEKEPNKAWIEYELDKVYKLHEMWVWNSNQTLESIIGFGFKDVTIEYSTNGADYTILGTTHEFARAPGAADYAHDTTVDFGGAAAKYVRLTANSHWGDITDQFGLSEVRFFSIPVFAREPIPDSGTTDVSVDVILGFRAGREAVTHDVYLSTDEQAVIDGNVPVISVTEVSHGPLSLELGTTYYWKINEVNMAETPTTWQGEIWNFTTHEFFVVEDFEDYNDYEPDEIWRTWVDGYGDPVNGATAGYPEPLDFPAGEHYMETTIVHGGGQSMPLFYDNTGTATYSDAKRTFAVPQDWTKGGVQTLALYFHGTAGNTGQMYVEVNGSKVVYPGDASNLARAVWQPWNIDLASLDLQSVTTLAIGIDGSGASGILYFDDFRLYSYSPEFITPVEPNNAGLMGHWKFDGDMLDYSGLGNDGTGFGDPTFVAGTVGSGALDFDGDDYVVLGEGGVLNFGDATDFSVLLWIKWAGTSSDPAFISNKDWNSGSNTGYVIADGGSTWQWNWNVSGGSRVDYDPSGPTLNDNQWHHLCVTHDRDGFATFYVDGVYQGRRDISGSTGSIDSGMPHVIAQDGTTTYGSTYAGLIDDARIYDYALSHAEVGWLSGRTLPFDEPF